MTKWTAYNIRISGAFALAWLTFGWSHPAFAQEDPATSNETPSISQLQLAPIDTNFTLNGNLGYTLRRDTTAGVATNSQSIVAMVTPGVNARSYIWQPWFAQVSGALGLNIYANSISTSAERYSSNNNSASIATVGNLTLNLVPASRFPFTAYYNRIDNRQNVNYGLSGVNTSTQNTNYGLDQRYRTLDGLTNYSGNYSHSFAKGASYNTNERDYSSFGMNTSRFQNQTISVTASTSLTQNSYSNERVQDNYMVAAHTYQPGNGFTMASMANAGFTDYRLTQQSHQSSYLQLSSYGSWQSDERPLNVTGSARLSGSREANNAWNANTNANLGVNYTLSQYFRTYATINLNDDDGVQTVTTTQALLANFNPRPIDLGNGLKYTRTATASLTNQTNPAGGKQTLATTLGHGLNRYSNFANGRLMSSVNQSIFASASRPDDDTPPKLQHNGVLAWDRSDASGFTFLRLSADDARSIGGKHEFFQILNLQANRTESLTRTSSLNGNLTTQKSRQGLSTSNQVSDTNDSSASLNYSNRRAFDLPRLLFNSELRVAGTGFVPVVSGPNEEASRAWTNSLNYAIGRIMVNCTASISETRKVKYSTLLFNINRSF